MNSFGSMLEGTVSKHFSYETCGCFSHSASCPFSSVVKPSQKPSEQSSLADITLEQDKSALDDFLRSEDDLCAGEGAHVRHKTMRGNSTKGTVAS